MRPNIHFNLITISDASFPAMLQDLHMPDFKMGSAVSAPMRPPLPKLTVATVTWIALETEASVVVDRGLWTSTRTLPTTLLN